MNDIFSINLLAHFGNECAVSLLSKTDQRELQEFLNNFDDFFILCTGAKGSAPGILSACPPSKNILYDKSLFGIYCDNNLIIIIDLIINYPAEGVITIGHLLVHPKFQSKNIGQKLIDILAKSAQGFTRFRCIVQERNLRALNFWYKNNFQVTAEQLSNIGNSESLVYILEKQI